MKNAFDMKCPQCGAEDDLDIEATVWVRLTADGTDADASHDGGHAWGGDSACRCDKCGWEGTVLNAEEA